MFVKRKEQDMPEKVAPRRIPQRANGERRVAAILDAADEVLAEVGYEAATMTEIAARAHTAIGSVYQFFPNKEAVVQALVERYLERINAIYDVVLAPRVARFPLPALLDYILDPLIEFHVGQAGLHAILSGMMKIQAQVTLRKDLDGRLASLFAIRVPALTAEQCQLYSLICIEIARGLVPLALGSEPEQRQSILAELKSVLIAYLEPRIGATVPDE